MVNEVAEKEKRIELLLEDVMSLEEYVRDLFDFSPLPISFVSPLNVFLEINPSFEGLSGYTFDELVGEPVHKIFKELDAEEIKKQVFEEGIIRNKEVELVREGEANIPVQVFAKARYNEEKEVVGYFLGLFDISEVREKEKELRQAQTALLNILEDTEEARRRVEREKSKTDTIIAHFSDGLIVADKKRNITLVNPKAEEMFEVQAGELVGQKIGKVSNQGRMEPFVKLVLPSISESFSRKELKLGKELIVEISNIIMEEREEKLGHLFVIHDVTRERTVERLKTEFVSIAAHQLRTPLSAIKWSLKMILDGDVGELEKEQREFIEKTYRSNERMIVLVNSLLNVTRIEEGRFVYKRLSTDIVELIENVIKQIQPMIKRKELDFVFHKPSKKLPKMKVDREKMSIVIYNLIDNAVKYTLEGGKVEVYLKKKKGEIEFRVEDTGVGVPKDQQKRIFTKFFRGANVIRLETVGTGLGLFITKNIVEAHDGEIDFESKEGEGSSFWFKIPLT